MVFYSVSDFNILSFCIFTFQYEKELLFGRIFCILSLIKGKKVQEDDAITKCVKELVKMAGSKSYLEQISFHGICELIEQVIAT